MLEKQKQTLYSCANAKDNYNKKETIKPPVSTLWGPDTWSPDAKEQIEYHYDKAKRLENAPKIVKDYYSGKGPNFNKGFFGWLVATKSNKIMLFVLCIMLAVCACVGVFGKKDNTDTLSGLEFSLTAFRYEENIYITLCTEAKNKVSAGFQKDIQKNFTAEFSSFDSPTTMIQKKTINFYWPQSEQTQEKQKKESAIQKERAILRDYDIMLIRAVIKDTKTQKQITIKTTVK